MLPNNDVLNFSLVKNHFKNNIMHLGHTLAEKNFQVLYKMHSSNGNCSLNLVTT